MNKESNQQVSSCGIRPHRSVGAGRARGASRQLITRKNFAKNHRHLISSARFFLDVAQEVEVAGPLAGAFGRWILDGFLVTFCLYCHAG